MNEFLKKLMDISDAELPDLDVKELPHRVEKRILKKTFAKIAQEHKLASYQRLAGSFVSLRRKVALVVAVMLMLGGAITAYAYRAEVLDAAASVGEAIKRVFTREEELIDQNAVFIDQAASNGEITLTVEKAVRDGDIGYLYLNLESGSTPFKGTALLYDEVKLERLTKYKFHEKYEMVYEDQMGEKGLLAGKVLYFLRKEPTDAADIILPLPLTEPGEYRLTLTRLFSALDEVDQSGEYTGNILYIDYADELAVTFELDEMESEIYSASYTPMTTFDIGDASLTLESLRITPVKIELSVIDEIGQTVELGGFEFPATEYLKGFYSPDGIEFGSEEYKAYIKEHNDDVLNMAYEVRIKFKDDVSSVDKYTSGLSWRAYDLDEMDRVYATFNLLTPIYESDIECIYLERKDGIYGSGEGDTIVIWEGKE